MKQAEIPANPPEPRQPASVVARNYSSVSEAVPAIFAAPVALEITPASPDAPRAAKVLPPIPIAASAIVTALALALTIRASNYQVDLRHAVVLFGTALVSSVLFNLPIMDRSPDRWRILFARFFFASVIGAVSGGFLRDMLWEFRI